MRILIEVCAALLFGTLVLAVIGMDTESPKASNFPKAIPNPDAVHQALGELRCEDRGAIVIKVDGRDYAVNGMASPRYPPIQALWTEHSHPKIDIDRLIVHGITLCAW
jgi:hypothetical protein